MARTQSRAARWQAALDKLAEKSSELESAC
jgi:hypothetical protein